MIRRPSLVFGTARDWAAMLDLADSARGKRRLPLREMNWLLDAVVVAQDAEAEAREAAKRLTPRRPMRRLDR